MHDSESKPGERVKDVHLTADTLAVDLIDRRTIVVPLAWYPRLLDATPEQRGNWRVGGGGYGIHWPDIDEDLSTAGLLRGAPAAAEGKFATNAKDFYLKEYESQRKQVEWLLRDYRTLERNVVIAVGVTWGWLFKQNCVPKWAWFIPCLFASLGALRALGIEKSGYALKEYIKLLEAAFSHWDDPGGWEHRFEKIRLIKTAYLFGLS
jgi:hypothetical protein